MLAAALRWYMVDSIGSGSDFFHVSGDWNLCVEQEKAYVVLVRNSR